MTILPPERPRTLYAKLWDSHVVREREDGSTLLYVDRHLLHEVSTPQSFVALAYRQASLADFVADFIGAASYFLARSHCTISLNDNQYHLGGYLKTFIYVETLSFHSK